MSAFETMMTLSADTAPPLSVAEQAARLRRVQDSGGHADVLRSVEPLLRDFPENRDLLLLQASSLRMTGRMAEALATLDKLGVEQPNFSRMWEERGLCHVALKDAPRAIEALLAAVNINPALPMSWRMLQGLYRLTGDEEKAATAAAHLAVLAAQPHEVVTATALFSDGEWPPAEQIVRAYLLRHGDHPEAMRLLAKIGMAHDVLDDAQLLLEGVLAIAPDHLAARFDYAQCLVLRHNYAAAQAQIALLREKDSGSFDVRAMEATIAQGLGDHPSAIMLYRDMLFEQPQSSDVHLWLGHALKTVGEIPEAVDAYRNAAAARLDFGDAYWSLANLKTYRFRDEEIARMRSVEASDGLAATDRIHLCFALGKALEDRKDFAESWRYYARGNDLKRAESRYRPEIIEINTRQQIETCTADFFAERHGWGIVDRDPIFIVGLPRSGSTLIEQILASHSQVEGTQELAEVQRIVLELQGREPDLDHPRYPAILQDLKAEDLQRLGQRYLAETRVYRSTGKPLFIDKMPNNFRHIGLIHLMLPNARIIDARREPMSCCFSNLKQLFANGQEFTYSIEDIARYYDTYLDLMDHWDRVVPGRILRVQHEDVVDDLEGSVRRILDHCTLPFEQACVDFHANERSVRTPSSQQVRQPIFRDGLDQWRKFGSCLDPLRGRLGNALDRCRAGT